MTDAVSSLRGRRGAEPFRDVAEPGAPLLRRSLARRRVATVEHAPVGSPGCLGLAADADERRRRLLLP